MGTRLTLPTVAGFLLFSATLLHGQPADFVPDPRSVVRSGPAYRYGQAGWTVLRIEGSPYERGVQHGTLMADEIAAHVRCFAASYSAEGPDDAWNLIRVLSEALFVHRFEREYLEEMRGIADGAAAAGAKFDDRPLDLTDIAALNLWPEIMSLEWGAAAIPKGLEGLKLPTPSGAALPPKAGHCSAFAATGPATADGKIVFGHITMYSLYPSTFYNIWLDVKPERGHRVLMQSFPGGIHSGMDYYINDSGILVSETTIDQTRFDVNGSPLAGRIRKSLQYADSIDDVVAVLKEGNNGLYTNEWMIADIKTNEIAMFELGTSSTRLYRSSKGEWFGGTEGFYWGCNNAKDLDVRLETIPATNDRPENLVWRPSDRDVKWVELYRKNKGKIGVDFAKEAFTTPPLCASASVDAKFTTTELAKGLRAWAIFGPPREQVWEATDKEKKDYPEVEPLVSNPWTILHGGPPPVEDSGALAVDLTRNEHPVVRSRRGENEEEYERPRYPQRVVWRGSLLPKGDSDIWLASAFAAYHRMVEQEKGMIEVAKDKCLCREDRSELGVGLYGARSRYLAAARASGDVPLSKLAASEATRDWYKLAVGKGVLVLGELRRRMGDERFVEAMDSFGFANAGKAVVWSDFASHMSNAAGEDLSGFFDYWVKGTGLPRFRLSDAKLVTGGEASIRTVEGVLVVETGPMPASVSVTVETDDDETTKIVDIGPAGTFRVDFEGEAKRVVVDKYLTVARANGGAFTVDSWYPEQEKTLIVYGTLDDRAANRASAELLQKKIRNEFSNLLIPIRDDTAMTDDELRDHHLILIGRPAVNHIADRFRASLPVEFGTQSFRVQSELYAHPRSALVVAGTNPLNPRFSIVDIAGLCATSTYLAVEGWSSDGFDGEVVVLPHGKKSEKLVIPPPELVKDFTQAERVPNGASH